MFELKLPIFEGPLDLLLHLIEKEELDITAVSLVQVTDQYLAQIHSRESLNLDALADFVAIGAKLIYLKSRALLPRAPAEAADLEEEEVGRELAEMLQEYKKFRDVAFALRAIEDEGLRAYRRTAPPPDVPLPAGLDKVTLDKLLKLFRDALDRLPAEPASTIERDRVTVRQKAQEIEEALRGEGQVSFRKLVLACRSRLEIVISFLAVLHLIKAGRVWGQQEELFGDISLVAIETPAPNAQ
ncbi:MAG: ScpA family protein [Dehalococcoidia bacterium]|jgi:segregation and condensation protein A